MDRRAIGVFDSGLGGLTAVAELRRLLPHEDIVYFGDTGRVPYGSRGREVIAKYATQDCAFLKTFDIKAILVACGTVSATSLDLLKSKFDLPITGVVEGAAKKAAEVTKNGKIGVIATAASIATGVYSREIGAIDSSLTVYEKACPLFVPIVENGRFERSDPLAKLLVSDYLASLRDKGIDTLVLGCTHYPLLADAIRDFMGESVTLVSSGAEAAALLADNLRDSLSDKGVGETKYFVSDSAEDFARYASMFLGAPLDGEAKKIDIDKY